MKPKTKPTELTAGLPKAMTGIPGLDEVTKGGFPAERPTLFCGGPGCGKTVLAMEFLVRGALQFGEPGVFVTMEETRADLVKNFRSVGFDLEALQKNRKIAILDLSFTQDVAMEAGEFSLDGLFIQLEQAVARVGAKRVAIDTLEKLFAHLPNKEILRAELSQLFRWLKEKKLTCVVTAELGDGSLTRHGIEAYVSDCVVLLDHRIAGHISKRRMRIIKYRGSVHGKDEYPFLIGSTGFSVMPLSSVQLNYGATEERIESGVADLDGMLNGAGFYRGSNVLVSGTAGTGKTTLAAAFAAAVCRGGKRVLFFSFEESPAQLLRNCHSVGIDLKTWFDQGSLEIEAVPSGGAGLEEHLVSIIRLVDDLRADAVVIDPITDFLSAGNQEEVHSMLTRVLHYLKSKRVTTFTTGLIRGSQHASDTAISSLVDTWISLEIDPDDPDHRRLLTVAKSRGMDHFRTTAEMIVSPGGIIIRDLPPLSDRRSYNDNVGGGSS